MLVTDEGPKSIGVMVRFAITSQQKQSLQSYIAKSATRDIRNTFQLKKLTRCTNTFRIFSRPQHRLSKKPFHPHISPQPALSEINHRKKKKKQSTNASQPHIDPRHTPRPGYIIPIYLGFLPPSISLSLSLSSRYSARCKCAPGASVRFLPRIRRTT